LVRKQGNGGVGEGVEVGGGDEGVGDERGGVEGGDGSGVEGGGGEGEGGGGAFSLQRVVDALEEYWKRGGESWEEVEAAAVMEGEGGGEGGGKQVDEEEDREEDWEEEDEKRETGGGGEGEREGRDGRGEGRVRKRGLIAVSDSWNGGGGSIQSGGEAWSAGPAQDSAHEVAGCVPPSASRYLKPQN